MKKSILNLGKALNKAAQKQINGGRSYECPSGSSWDNCSFKCVSNREQYFTNCD